MSLRNWRLLAIMLTAVAFSTAFAHLLELPAKLAYPPALYANLHRTLYSGFARVGGAAEILALIAVGGLAWRVRARRRGVFSLVLGAGGCLAVSMALFLLLVQPANAVIAAWPTDAIPADWTHWRDRWEITHAIRAILMLAALGALVLSALRETPREVLAAAPLSHPPGSGRRRASAAAPPRDLVSARSRDSRARSSSGRPRSPSSSRR